MAVVLPRSRMSIVLALTVVLLFLVCSSSLESRTKLVQYAQKPTEYFGVSTRPQEKINTDNAEIVAGKVAGNETALVQEENGASQTEVPMVEEISEPELQYAPANLTVKLKTQFKEEHRFIEENGKVGAIFGSSLNHLSIPRVKSPDSAFLKPSEKSTPSYSSLEPMIYDPYPDYNSKKWKQEHKGSFVECANPWNSTLGEDGDVMTFVGHPKNYPNPAFGSYDVLGLDKSLCFERETRLGLYGLENDEMSGATFQAKSQPIDWDNVDWGMLQDQCVDRNKDRFDASKPHTISSAAGMDLAFLDEERDDLAKRLSLSSSTEPTTQKRTAIVLRSHSRYKYTENDKQNIRALVNELSLRTGGEYQVFLLVQSKNDSINIWESDEIYNMALESMVPKEFWNMTILWDDALIDEIYYEIPEKARNVHVSQWLCVQKFAQDYPQFDYYWNWEVDFRYTGHYYDLLEKLSQFSKKQPRKGLWERNERYYMPALHGDYDTTFRNDVEVRSGNATIWHPPYVPNVNPIGPKPPVETPEEDNYEWGVGEDADYITLGPIFNPNGTNWIGRKDVWGYAGFGPTPERTTIVTHSRVSKTLLNIMHAENLKGNHVSSEMTPQTVALLHGLKAVYAPHPIFFDREWRAERLEKYFNPGPKGESGSSRDSPFGWGLEGRFLGSTWYFRADPPMRLYNNWLGWEDSGVGGSEWEKEHGRSCLPPMLLHPIKDVKKPPPGYSSKSSLPYSD